MSVLLLLLSVCLPASIAASARPPDIVVILADDMGYSDPGCFGGEIPTPHLDRLAAHGLRLSRCHNAAMCVASRASLLSGRWWPTALRNFDRDRLVPERLHAAGYRTGLIGKWHLKGHPMDHGFDRFFGFLGGFADHFNGGPDYRDDRKPFRVAGKEYYSSSSFATQAVRFIEATPDTTPMFLLVAYQAPHNPLQAPAEAIARYRGRYQEGWQVVREARLKRQRELGLLPAAVPLPAAPKNLPQWESLTSVQRDLEDLRMATYAAMVEILDRETGRILDALDAAGRVDNTLVVFLSDNGADPFSVVDAAMLAKGKLPGDPGSNYQPGLGWAHVANTPWRLNKISQHAGGVTTGAIVRWPSVIREPGRIDATPVHFTDLASTLLDVAGVDAATPDGRSFLPLFRGEPWRREAPMFFQYSDNRAIRTAERTLVAVDGSHWELYDTTIDPLEANDLAAQRPDEVKDLAARWDDWWLSQNNGRAYAPESSNNSPHYSPQGDRGTGRPYRPSSMRNPVTPGP